MKATIINCIRYLHLLSSQADYPNRVALIFHELLPRQRSQFEEAIGAFVDAGFQPVSAEEYCDPNSTIEKRLLVTFDDNFKHWVSSLNLIEKLGIKAVFYVNSGPICGTAGTHKIADYYNRIAHFEDPTPLSCGELKMMRDAGHIIGCHTHWHYNLGSLHKDDWQNAIKHSRDVLENMLGEPVLDFSYPFGMRRNFSEALRQYCVELGFKRIAEGRPGRLHDSVFNPLAIQRTRWNLDNTLQRNLEDIRIDGRVFERFTGRSAIG